MKEQNIPYKIYLTEEELPQAWYNLRADMINKPAPLLHPETHEPMTAEDLADVFCEELVKQELDDTTAYIPIPRRSVIFIKCTALRLWFVHTAWKRNWALLPRSTTNSKATTPPALTS